MWCMNIVSTLNDMSRLVVKMGLFLPFFSAHDQCAYLKFKKKVLNMLTVSPQALSTAFN